VSINILQERINISYSRSWFDMNLKTPNYHFCDETKKEISAIKRIYNKSTHSLEVDEQSDRP
jgi:hypothetical protein